MSRSSRRAAGEGEPDHQDDQQAPEESPVNLPNRDESPGGQVPRGRRRRHRGRRGTANKQGLGPPPTSEDAASAAKPASPTPRPTPPRAPEPSTTPKPRPPRRRGNPGSNSARPGPPADQALESALPSAPTGRSHRRRPRGPRTEDISPPPRRQRRARRALTVEEFSAGGIVIDHSSPALTVAVIARINRAGRLEWCLPKGHLEGEETAEQAAVREIFEETGIQGTIVASLGLVDYWFAVEGRRIHKQVHHFLLTAIGGQLTIEGDPDHEAIDVAWVPIAELQSLLAFPNERRIVREALAHLRAQRSPRRPRAERTPRPSPGPRTPRSPGTESGAPAEEP